MSPPPVKRPGMSDADRALVGRHNTPASGVPREDWHEEPTGVGTDAQVFRALKSLHGEIQANKVEAAKAHGALKQELVAAHGSLKSELTEHAKSVDGRLTKQDGVLAEQTVMISRMAGQLDVLVPMARSKSPSAETKAIVDKAVKASGTAWWRSVVFKLISGAIAIVSSAVFLKWWLS